MAAASPFDSLVGSIFHISLLIQSFHNREPIGCRLKGSKEKNNAP